MGKIQSQPNDKLFVLTAPLTAVIQAVYRYQSLTTQQIVKACGYSPKSIERVGRLAKQLVNNDYLLARPHPTTRGKSPLVYILARKGINYMKSAGCDVKEYFRPSSEEERSYLFNKHTLAVNDVLISATNLNKSSSDYSLTNFTHERVLKQTPYRVKFVRDGKNEIAVLIPDAYMLFVGCTENKDDKQIPILLELDRNTTEQKSFRKNLRARIEFMKSEGYKQLLGTHTATFAYAVAEGGTKRCTELRSWARKEFAETKESGWLPKLFLFSPLPRELEPKTLFLEKVWYTPFEDDTPVALLIDESAD